MDIKENIKGIEKFITTLDIEESKINLSDIKNLHQGYFARGYEIGIKYKQSDTISEINIKFPSMSFQIYSAD